MTSGLKVKSSRLTRVIFFEVPFKDGKPTLHELYGLSQKLGTKWKWLGRQLKISEPQLEKFQENEELDEKACQMLLYWKRKEGLSATYEVLYEALSHEHVGLKELAETICLAKSCIS